MSAIVLALAATVTMVPPDRLTEDHTQPYHWGQPVLHSFERHADDYDRRVAWEAHTRELEELWREYREAGSTPRAFRTYQHAASQAKRRYVFGDRYLAPIVNDMYFIP